jgi:hypothetical protein
LQFKWIQIANLSTIMIVFIELNNDFISCIHRASAHMQNCPYLCIGWKYKDLLYIFGANSKFFLRGSIKFLGSELKFWVGRVSGNTTFFLVWPCLRGRRNLHIEFTGLIFHPCTLQCLKFLKIPYLPNFKVDKIMSIGMRVPNPLMSDPERVYPRLSGGVNV